MVLLPLPLCFRQCPLCPVRRSSCGRTWTADTRTRCSIWRKPTGTSVRYFCVGFRCFIVVLSAGNTKQSSLHCYATLRRQLVEGLDTAEAQLEWITNGQGLSDFFIATDQYELAAYVLSICEDVLHQLKQRAASLTIEIVEKIDEHVAKVNRRWVKVDMNLLRDAVDRSDAWTGSSGWDKSLENNVSAAVAEATAMGFAPFPQYPMKSIPLVSQDPSRQINNYEDAKLVFLRAQLRLDQAKRYFVLDGETDHVLLSLFLSLRRAVGYVTDHIGLLLDHSKLFLYLSTVDPDVKRKLAMQLKRAEMLQPLLRSVNRQAFEDVMKQVSYELGEVYMNCLELKLNKLQKKQATKPSASSPLATMDELDTTAFTAKETQQVNDYCRLSLLSFSYFTRFYEARGDDNAATHRHCSSVPPEKLLEIEDLDVAIQTACLDPDWKLLSADEVRPYLNSQFLCCRVMSKIIPRQERVPGQTVRFLVASLKRYQWLAKMVPMAIEKKQIPLENIPFEEEFNITLEMCQLLPSKLDAMMRNR